MVLENVERDSHIVEAVGEWADYALISRSTGMPTIVNWIGHQRQWRGGWDKFEAATSEDSQILRNEYFERRAQEVETVYTSQDWSEVVRVLYKYDIDYVYLSSREKSRYAYGGLLEQQLKPAFVSPNEQVKILRVD